LVKSGVWNFTWSVRDDPCEGSDHFPIDINFYNSNEPNPGTDFNPNRTRLSLNLDKKLFAMLVAKHIPSIPFDVEAVQQYEKWYNVIIECSLFARGSIICNNGICKRFDPKNNCIIHYRYKQCKKQFRVKPWWDEICQEALDSRRNCYKEFFRYPNK